MTVHHQPLEFSKDFPDEFGRAVRRATKEFPVNWFHQVGGGPSREIVTSLIHHGNDKHRNSRRFRVPRNSRNMFQPSAPGISRSKRDRVRVEIFRLRQRPRLKWLLLPSDSLEVRDNLLTRLALRDQPEQSAEAVSVR